MNNTQTIHFNWDKESKSGTLSLLLNVDVLKRYALSPFPKPYNKGIQTSAIPFSDIKSFEGAKKEVNDYENILADFKLSQESTFHSSHILSLLLAHTIRTDMSEEQQEVKRKLHNRIYFLKRLMHLKDYKDYNIEIYDSAKGSFKYHFASEPILKDSVIRHVINEMQTQLKGYDNKLYNLLMSGATEDELELAVQRQSDHQINKVLVAELARRILKYLNTETVVLRNNDAKDSLSVSNQQGNFIYEILTMYQAYKPKNIAGASVVKHHDAIRKLIKRSVLMDEDK